MSQLYYNYTVIELQVRDVLIYKLSKINYILNKVYFSYKIFTMSAWLILEFVNKRKNKNKN
jgi:hypothetical protein